MPIILNKSEFSKLYQLCVLHKSNSCVESDSMVLNNASPRSVAIGLGYSQLKPPTPKKVHALGWNLTALPSTVQLFLLSVLVFVFYILYGYIQEAIFKVEGFKPFGWYLTLIQFMLYSLFSATERFCYHKETRRIPIQTYAFLAMVTVATMGLSNASLGYLNYPTQVIFKCCKLIPVLIGSIIIQGKRYGLLDFSSAILMSIGLILFTLADNKVLPNFDIRGYIMICGALVADAIIGNVQEKTMKKHGSNNSEMIFYSYSIGCVYIFFGMLISGDLFDAIKFCARNPETYVYAAIFSLTGFIGINIVLTLVTTFGAFIAVTVTTCRKAITIILSFILFTKPFTFQYVWSGLIVMCGIYMSVYSKNKSKWNPHLNRIFQTLVLKFERIIKCFRKRSYHPTELV